MNLLPASKTKLVNEHFAESLGLRSDQPLHGCEQDMCRKQLPWTPADVPVRVRSQEVSQSLEVKHGVWLSAGKVEA